MVNNISKIVKEDIEMLIKSPLYSAKSVNDLVGIGDDEVVIFNEILVKMISDVEILIGNDTGMPVNSIVQLAMRKKLDDGCSRDGYVNPVYGMRFLD